jgi:hypothetical protein
MVSISITSVKLSGTSARFVASSEAPVDEMSRTVHVIIFLAKLIRPAFQMPCRSAFRFSSPDDLAEEVFGSDFAATIPDLILP